MNDYEILCDLLSDNTIVFSFNDFAGRYNLNPRRAYAFLKAAKKHGIIGYSHLKVHLILLYAPITKKVLFNMRMHDAYFLKDMCRLKVMFLNKTAHKQLINAF